MRPRRVPLLHLIIVIILFTVLILFTTRIAYWGVGAWCARYALSIGRVAGWYVAEAGSCASHAEAEGEMLQKTHI